MERRSRDSEAIAILETGGLTKSDNPHLQVLAPRAREATLPFRCPVSRAEVRASEIWLTRFVSQPVLDVSRLRRPSFDFSETACLEPGQGLGVQQNRMCSYATPKNPSLDFRRAGQEIVWPSSP